MNKLTLTDQDGHKIKGNLPSGWHEVNLTAYMGYHAALATKPKGMEGLLIIQHLTELPEDVLKSDTSIAKILLKAMPWLKQLPSPEALLTFEHLGKTYEHVGNLDKVSTEQFEALFICLENVEENVCEAFPSLLAVLYKEQGKEQDAVTVANTAEAFQTLPMSLAWGALSFFLTSSVKSAERIQAFSKLKAEVLQMVKTAQEHLNQRPPSHTLSSFIASKLGKRYMKYVATMLEKS